MDNVTTYTDYFRQLATNHSSLRHNPESEEQDTSNQDKHFAKWSMDELVTGIRSKCKSPCMYLELFEMQLKHENLFDVRLPARGAFSILTSVAAGASTSEEERAYANSYKIMFEILQQMYLQHYGEATDPCTTAFHSIDFDDVAIQAVGPQVDNYYGYRVEFGFRFKADKAISDAPDVGTFISDDYEGVILGDGEYYLGY